MHQIRFLASVPLSFWSDCSFVRSFVCPFVSYTNFDTNRWHCHSVVTAALRESFVIIVTVNIRSDPKLYSLSPFLFNSVFAKTAAMSTSLLSSSFSITKKERVKRPH